MSPRRLTPAEAFAESVAEVAWTVAGVFLEAGVEALRQRILPPPRREPRLAARGAGSRAGKARRGAPRGAGRKPSPGPVLETRKIGGVWHVV